MADVTALLDELGIPYRTEGHAHARHGWVQVDCPTCSPGRQRWRLGINISGRYCNCWQCGYKPLMPVLAELASRSEWEVNQAIRAVGWTPTERAERPKQTKGKLTLPPGVGEMTEAHKHYLREGRGLSPKTVAKLWGVKGIGIGAEFSWSLFIPIIHDGEMISWTTRAIGEDVERRYVNAARDQEVWSPKQFLYGSDYARSAVVVHEGPIDVWATGPGAVALMGLTYTVDQVQRLSRFPVRAICFDAEPNAQQRAHKLAAELAKFPGDTIVVELETGKDTAEADRKEVQEIRRKFLED